ncbi:MAG: acyl-CoA dehydrogenase family protein [Myxococcales bacterium]|nr:acyl-CoA dehydrogenase family protein [Myxococcales bacterium]MDH3484640.1 acyl-CoA dehydrogenase family protein [Myxococcales bacterium]
MIYLELPKNLRVLANQAHQIGKNVFRPISQKYDEAEHDYPKELDMLAALLDGLDAGGGRPDGGGVAGLKQKRGGDEVNNGANMATCVGLTELCWGDVGLALSIPRQGLGNAAISAVASAEQKKRFEGLWAAMAITEPGAGSDSANIRTTARLDGDEWVLNGEKIYVTAGSRADAVVVWATLDRNLGRAAIKSFVVPHGTPGMEVVRLDRKLGIRASDTASITLIDCRIPKENLLGNEDIDTKEGFGGVMQTFDNTRPTVAAMAVGVARAALDHARELLSKEGIEVRYRGSIHSKSAVEAELIRMEAEWEAGRLLMLKASWMADNGIPNSMEASMSKAKAARVANEITLRCVELCGGEGYSQRGLLEKWARDSKILDIFEGTQQIQLLIIARRLLGKRSAELR